MLRITRASDGYQEKLLCSTRSGTTVDIEQRGFDDTVAASFDAGDTIEHVLDAATVQEIYDIAGRALTNEGGELDSDGTVVFKGSAGDMHALVRSGTGRQELLLTDPAVETWLQVLGPLDENGPRVALKATGSNALFLTENGIDLMNTEVNGGRFVSVFDKHDSRGNLGSTPTFDFENQSSISGTLDANATPVVTWPAMDGSKMYTVQLALAVGPTAYTVSWPSDWRWIDDNEPDLSAQGYH